MRRHSAVLFLIAVYFLVVTTRDVSADEGKGEYDIKECSELIESLGGLDWTDLADLPEADRRQLEKEGSRRRGLWEAFLKRTTVDAPVVLPLVTSDRVVMNHFFNLGPRELLCKPVTKASCAADALEEPESDTPFRIFIDADRTRHPQVLLNGLSRSPSPELAWVQAIYTISALSNFRVKASMTLIKDKLTASYRGMIADEIRRRDWKPHTWPVSWNWIQPDRRSIFDVLGDPVDKFIAAMTAEFFGKLGTADFIRRHADEINSTYLSSWVEALHDPGDFLKLAAKDMGESFAIGTRLFEPLLEQLAALPLSELWDMPEIPTIQNEDAARFEIVLHPNDGTTFTFKFIQAANRLWLKSQDQLDWPIQGARRDMHRSSVRYTEHHVNAIWDPPYGLGIREPKFEVRKLIGFIIRGRAAEHMPASPLGFFDRAFVVSDLKWDVGKQKFVGDVTKEDHETHRGGIEISETTMAALQKHALKYDP